MRLYKFLVQGKTEYVFAQNWKKARNKVLERYNVDSLLDIYGHKILKNIDHPPGIISIKELCDEQIVWWECRNCGGTHFRAIDDGSKYRCLDCGIEAFIPNDQERD